MAILGMDGFDHYATDDGGGLTDDALAAVENYTMQTMGQTNSRILDSDTRFWYGKYLHMIYSNAGLRINVAYAATDTIYVCYAVKFTTAMSNTFLITWRNDDDSQNNAFLYLHANGTFSFLDRDLNVLATSTSAVSLDTWYWLEAKVTIHPTAGVVQLQVNGEDWIAETTGKDTWYSGATNNCGVIVIQGDSSTDISVDDLVWMDDGGNPDATAPEAPFLGDSRIETFMPTADTATTDFTRGGTVNDGTADYMNIDEIPADDDENYILSSTLNHESLFDTDTIDEDDKVHAVSARFKAKKTDTGARAIQSRTSELVTGTDVQGGTARDLTTTYVEYADIFETTDDGTPDAGTAWTKALVGTATFGIKVTT